MQTINTTCQQCGKEFEYIRTPRSRERKYCSKSCQRRSDRIRVLKDNDRWLRDRATRKKAYDKWRSENPEKYKESKRRYEEKIRELANNGNA